MDDHTMQDSSSEAALIPGPDDDVEMTQDDRPVKLEDLFNSDDENELAALPAAVQHETGITPSSPIAPPPPVQAGLSASDPVVMRSFYQRLFPWRDLFQWLNHGPTPGKDFAHREFAFTLQNNAYQRYQSFATSDLLRKDILGKMPSRFEIGPVYSANPRDRKMLSNVSTFKPIAKELCFDIDLTDYDGVRTCCEKTSICVRCWRFIALAIRVLDTALRDDFGFKHILWVYSGRRGAHAWVCDQRARELEDKERRAILGYLEVVRGGTHSGKKVNVRRPLHPHLSRSLNILKDYFQNDILDGQDPWQTEEGAEKLLALLPDRTLNEALRKKWDAAPGRSSSSKWADIDAVARTGASKSLDARALLEAKQDIVLEYTYPRLDSEVTKKLSHLLKSPFVVHPGTGQVCVPMMIGEGASGVDAFNPLEVPTVHALLEEVNAWKLTQSDGETPSKALKDWEKTSLRPYIQYMRAFVSTLVMDEKGFKIKEESLEF